jgi:UDP-glucose-4-epimerase GalE
MSTVVVTGASGYIGGQIALQLKDAGYQVVGIDLIPCPAHLSSLFLRFVTNNFASEYALDMIQRSKPIAVIHCAGTSLVGPSLTDPQTYYRNNVVNTLCLLDKLKTMPATRLIFSSSAATYGNPAITPIQEDAPTEPLSPYGQSKLMIDWMLNSYARAYNLDFVSFRYFNACGADSQTRHGQNAGATHIIARVLESLRDDREFVLYGNDYATPDGTCIRDYVHVEDIANAHVRSIDRSVPAGIYNLGTGTGVSNMDVIVAAQEITGKALAIRIGPRREGDPAILVADTNKIKDTTGWDLKYKLNDMITHAYQWYNK